MSAATTHDRTGTLAELVADACADLARHLVAEGFEGGHFLAAFERMRGLVVRAVVAGTKVSTPEPVTALQPVSAPRAPEMARPKARTAVATRKGGADPRQQSFNYPFEGGQAKTPPMTAAERQAKRRARLKNVTKRDINGSQVFEIIDESRNVTKKRDSLVQVVDSVENSANLQRDSVTRRAKRSSPHTPLKKNKPPSPPSDGGEYPHIPWDNPLIPFLDEVCGRLKAQFGSGRTVRRQDLLKAQALMAERLGEECSLRSAG